MTSLLAFIVLIGVLIAAHEFGHFIVAKLSGVKVECFSIGFGSPIFSVWRGETEYRVAWIPLGGYVRLLGQDPTAGPPPPEDEGRALMDKPPFIRILIFLAGPVMNLVLPFAIIAPYVALADRYQQVAGNEVGAVNESMPAYVAGMREGDRIVEIDGEPIHAFWQIKKHVDGYDSAAGALHIQVDRPTASAPIPLRITPQVVERTHPILGYTSRSHLIGYQPAFLNCEVAVFEPGGAADAGLRTFDRVISIDGAPVTRYVDLIDRLGAVAAGDTVTVRVARADDAIDPRFPSIRVREEVDLTFRGATGGRAALGLHHAGACVTSVAKDGPAQGLLERGDCLVAVDGQGQSVGGFLLRSLDNRPGEAKAIRLVRDGRHREISLTQRRHTFNDAMAGEVPYWQRGFSLPSRTLVTPSMVVNRNRLAHGWFEAVTQVPHELEVTLRSIGGLLSGQVSPTQLSGPLTIFHLAGSQAEAGLGQFLRLMVLLSLSIGLFNLLPIPLLDGGHILVAGVEMVTRRPLPPRIQAGMQYVGLVLILALILFALGNDAVRTWRLTNG
jgi:regulator of sigma E protease